ncbi:MAG: aspartate 1-decarboxylase [Symploca sp. SIO1A3]|nr:aspartate 1-decarboxylase [Symploca sp. SIO1A3]
MNIKTLYAKLHRAICTESRLDYMGSVTIDQDWMDAAGLQDGQAMDVLNLDNGARLTTYAISGERGLGEICLNGAAAHRFEPGHKVILIAYCDLTLEEKEFFQPKVLLFDDHPPFEIDHQNQKLRWLKERPTYSLPEKETPATTYASLAKSSKKSESEQLLAKNWQLGCQLLWNQAEIVVGLSAFMRENHVKTVLDVSGGNGFPALELRRQGWDIAYNDYNAFMKGQVEAQIKGKDDFLASMPCTQLSWEQLDQAIAPSSYDMILCRGNSLPYATSWSVNQICEPEKAKVIIQKALEQFFQVLSPGGVLLVDKSSFESTGIYVVQKEGEVEGKDCHIHWVFVNDLDAELRRWDQYNTVEQQTTCLTVYSLLITEKMLCDWLTKAGFVSVCQTPIRGEDIYTVFTARKPVGETTVAKTSDYYNQQNAIYSEVWDAQGRICWGYYPPDKPELAFEEAGRKHVERMASMIALDAKSKALDVGCGNGVTAIWLAQNFGCQVVGIDPSPTNIEKATELASQAGITDKVTFICGTIQEGGFPDNEFTHIWSNAALSHIPEQERKANFTEMQRILGHQGTLIFDDSISPTGKVDDHAREWVYERLHFDKLYTIAEYVDLLASSGFEVEKVDDLTQHQQKSYEVLSQRAQAAGYSRLAKAYWESSKASGWGTLGWAIFLAKPQ